MASEYGYYTREDGVLVYHDLAVVDGPSAPGTVPQEGQVPTWNVTLQRYIPRPIPSGSDTPQATTTSVGTIALAGDLAGSATAPTVPGLALKLNTNSNLADVPNKAAARTNLGLSETAIMSVGSVAGTLAAGDDPRFTNPTVAPASITNVQIASGAAINLDKTVDSTTRLAFLPAERTKLGGIATGATANSTDAQLRDRTTHTGVTPRSGIGTGTPSAGMYVDGGTGAWTPLGGGGGGGTGAVVDATTTSRGVIVLAGDLAGTADLPTVPGLALRLSRTANLSDLGNVGTARINLGLGSAALASTGTATGQVPVLGTNGVLDKARLGGGTPAAGYYVDGGTGNWTPLPAGSGGVTPDATPTFKGIIQLAGDLAGTAAAPTVPGKLTKTSNLADLPDKAAARTNLGLSAAAVAAFGTTAGTVAAGNDIRIIGAMQSANSLSDVLDTTAARTNLGLGSAATATVGVLAGQIPVLATGGVLPPARLGTGPRSSGMYVDGATGAWTPLPSGSGGTGTFTLDTAPAGYVHSVVKNGDGTWPDRGTTRTDIRVLAIGPDPDPTWLLFNDLRFII